MTGLIPALTGAVFLGMTYQALTETSSSLPVYILSIKEVAEYALYHLGTMIFESHQSHAMLYAAINLTVNAAALAALRHYEMIGMAGTALFASLMAVELFCKSLDFTKYSEKSAT